jgi:hypothetical protein
MKREEEIDLAYTDYVSTELKTDETTYIRDAFIAGAKWADLFPKNKWCNAEIHPPFEVNVLVFDAQENYAVAYFSHVYGDWFTTDGESINVVSWIPLPKLPTR